MTPSYSTAPWSLGDLFPSHDAPEMQAALAELERGVAEFEQRRPQLTSDLPAGPFLEIVRQLEAIHNLGSRIAGFASLAFAADTQSQAAQAFLASVESKIAELQNRTLFFSLWWKDLDEAPAKNLMAAAGDYRYWLEEMRHFKPHTLSEPEEKVVNLKNTTGAQAFHNLYDAITNRYAFRLIVDGEEKELTRGGLMVYARHPDPELRQQAYQELYRVYGQDGTILGAIYQTLVRDWRLEQVGLRAFASPIAARNLANDLPEDVVDTLLQVCQDNASVFQRYFQLKARILGLPRLRRYDIYAPVSSSGKSYTFDEAASLVLDAYHHFDSQVAELAMKVFKSGHLDSQVRKGKRDGAFCATITPELTPWVLVNFQGRAEDVATLAHELGHAVHSLLASQHSLFTQHSNLPLAETASTFGEMLLVDRLLSQEIDQGVRRDLLFKQVDDAYATVMRQAFFALFERQAHELVQQGATTDELAGVYLENLHSQFGAAVEVGEEFRWEWVSIPHIYHVPFYVYAYTFGQLLVLSLYQQYKSEAESFKPRYLKILQAGGSQAPEAILSQAGVDVRAAQFWQGGFEVIGQMVSQLEALPVD